MRTVESLEGTSPPKQMQVLHVHKVVHADNKNEGMKGYNARSLTGYISPAVVPAKLPGDNRTFSNSNVPVHIQM